MGENFYLLGKGSFLKNERKNEFDFINVLNIYVVRLG